MSKVEYIVKQEQMRSLARGLKRRGIKDPQEVVKDLVDGKGRAVRMLRKAMCIRKEE